jgi:hypothetical protein
MRSSALNSQTFETRSKTRLNLRRLEEPRSQRFEVKAAPSHENGSPAPALYFGDRFTSPFGPGDGSNVLYRISNVDEMMSDAPSFGIRHLDVAT